MKSEKRRYFQVAEIAQKTVIYTIEMPAVDGQKSKVRSTVLLAIESALEDVFVKVVIAGDTQWDVMRTGVLPAIKKPLCTLV